jgi:hypothetical protein
MKTRIKTMMAVAALALATGTAFANMRDSRFDSAKRYGQPINRDDHFTWYSAKGYLKGEWYNPDGRVEGIIYANKSGQCFSRTETEAFGRANGLYRPDWIEIDPTNPNTTPYRVFISADQQFRFESGSGYIGFSTIRCATALNSHLVSQDQIISLPL